MKPMTNFKMSHFYLTWLAAILFCQTIYARTISTSEHIQKKSISVRQLGVVGNGQADDTEALQAILDQASDEKIVFDGGEFLINGTLVLKSGVEVIGKNGATLKAGPNMTGSLQRHGRFIYVANVSNCTISGLKFMSEKPDFGLAGWGDAAISILNSVNTTIENNVFDFNQPLASRGVEAIWVSGPQTRNTVIKNNVITGMGIQYAENGASGTTVENNKLYGAHCNGLSANGNSDVQITGCRLINNTIETTGRMGIEDWGLVDGTIIEGNIITQSGADPNQAHEGFGISAVGTNTRVLRNKIVNAKVYYLELGGNHNIVAEGNEITDDARLATGIILNYTGKVPGSVTSNYSQVLNNTINGCDKAIHVFGEISPNCLVKGNTLNDPKSRGISVESDAISYNVEVSQNTVHINSPTKIFRLVLNTFSSVPREKAKQNFVLDGNVVTYSANASSDTGFDLCFLVLTDNSRITNNKVYGNNVKSGGYPVYGIGSNGGEAFNCTIADNDISGALSDLTGYKNATKSGNVFSNAIGN